MRVKENGGYVFVVGKCVIHEYGLCHYKEFTKSSLKFGPRILGEIYNEDSLQSLFTSFYYNIDNENIKYM